MIRTTMPLLLGFLLITPVHAQTETQDFDPGPPQDWLDFESQHPEVFVNYGWDDGSGTNFESANIIGDGPGWAGGLFSRPGIDNSIYADVTIGEYTLEDQLRATGKVWWKELGFNYSIYIGFMDASDVLQDDLDDPSFNETPDFVGMRFLEGSRMHASYLLDENFADFGLSQRFATKGPKTIPQDTPMEFEIFYDGKNPGGFGEGKLTVTLTNPATDVSESNELFMPLFASDAETQFNAFGFLLIAPASAPAEVMTEAFIDDVEYTSNGTCGVQDLCDMLAPVVGTNIAIIPGDGDLNGTFDTGDIVLALGGSKFEKGLAATWAEGDWDAAPDDNNTYDSLETGGGTPPVGNGVFDTSDVVAALGGGHFEKGSVLAALKDPAEGEGTDQVVVTYDAADGNVSVNATQPITSISLESASGIFTGSAAANLGGPFDVDTDVKVFKAVFGDQFSEVDFGAVAGAGLAKEVLLDDLTASGSLAGGGGTFGPDVQLNYIPEPSTMVLLSLGFVGLVVCARRKR